MADSTGASLTYGQTLLRALVLGRVLEREWGPAAHVGLLVPPTVPAAVANLAVSLWGKIPVNLNYSASQALVDSSIDQCGITHVLTSAKVLDRFKITPKGQADPARGHPRAGAPGRQALGRRRRQGWCRSRLLAALRARACENDHLDATATVIFTSGSTGDPKGVVLSHRNILSNVHQIEEQVHLKPDEVLLGILPFFHSFGFTITIWTAICLGKKVVYHFNPLDARTIGKLCEQHKVTLLIGTPSFMRFYLKSCEPKQFRTLTHLIAGCREAQARAGPRDPERSGHRAAGGLRLHRAFAGRRGERAQRRRAAGRPQDPRQPPGHGRAAAARHGDQDDRPRHRGRPARRAPKG